MPKTRVKKHKRKTKKGETIVKSHLREKPTKQDQPINISIFVFDDNLINEILEEDMVRCYTCGEKVDSDDTINSSEFEDMEHNKYMFAIDYLDLTHCIGDKDQFDDKGTPYTCQNCFNNMKKEYKKG